MLCLRNLLIGNKGAFTYKILFMYLNEDVYWMSWPLMFNTISAPYGIREGTRKVGNEDRSAENEEGK